MYGYVCMSTSINVVLYAFKCLELLYETYDATKCMYVRGVTSLASGQRVIMFCSGDLVRSKLSK